MNLRELVVKTALLLSIVAAARLAHSADGRVGTGASLLPSRVHAASREYQRKRDLASLMALLPQIGPGTPRRDVEKLLGPSVYAPTQLGDETVFEPQAYYGTDSDCWHQDLERPAPCVLVINYHVPSHLRPGEPPVPERLWDTVADFHFGPVGE